MAEPIDHRGGDVLAVPHGPYVDTTGDPGNRGVVRRRVAALDRSRGVRGLSAAVNVDAGGRTKEAATINVDASSVRGPVERPWRPIIGSEHLALLLRGAGPGGSDVGAELAEAFVISRRELGHEWGLGPRILHDSLEVYREVDGRPVHDFGLGVDAVLDGSGRRASRPVVELSFMPRCRSGLDPDSDRLRLPRDHLAAARYGALGEPLP